MTQGSLKLAVFDTHRFERPHFERANREIAARGQSHQLTFFEARLTAQSATLAQGYDAVCCFVADQLDAATLRVLHEQGVRIVALRCAGYNNVDLKVAAELGIPVVRVPEYSPHAVAEHAVALVLALNRKIHRAHARVREGNFSLEGLVGFDLYGKCVGILGTGKIGRTTARVFAGFGCNVLAYDLQPNEALQTEGIRYASLSEIYSSAQILSLHVPLTPQTHHMIDAQAIAAMRPGVMLINTGRGALIDSKALIGGLKTGQVGSAGLDVYEEEEGVFFQDLSDRVLQDDVLARLLTFPNVLITAHQAFLTEEALNNIANTTLQNLSAFARGEPLVNQVQLTRV